SVPDDDDLKAGVKSFDRVAIYATNLYNVSLEGGGEQVLGVIVSPEFFPLLGQPRLGAGFTEATDRERLVILSHRFSLTPFGGDPGVIGRTLHLSRQAHTIVGVMPPEFQFPRPDAQLWVTFGSAMGNASDQARNRALRIFRAVAHLAPGATVDQARAETDALS